MLDGEAAPLRAGCVRDVRSPPRRAEARDWEGRPGRVPLRRAPAESAPRPGPGFKKAVSPPRPAPSRPAESGRLRVPPLRFVPARTGAGRGLAEPQGFRSRPSRTICSGVAGPGRPPPPAPAGACVGVIIALSLRDARPRLAQAAVPPCPAPPLNSAGGSGGSQTTKTQDSGSSLASFCCQERLAPPVALRTGRSEQEWETEAQAEVSAWSGPGL